MVSLADVLDAQAQVESGGNPRARSYKNAQGLHQFMPATWKQYGNGKDINDPVANRDAAARYLTDLYNKHGSLPLALAAYNGGDGGANFLRKNPYLMHHPDKKAPINQWRHQTADYVNKIMSRLPADSTGGGQSSGAGGAGNDDEWEDVTPAAQATTNNTADEWEDVTPTAAPIQAAQPEQKQPMSWGDVASGAVSNIIPSTGRMIGGLAEAAMHPIDTAQSVGTLVNQGLEHLVPESARGDTSQADALADAYKQRYGGVENIKHSIAEDPASVLMDASMVFGGVGAGARAANLPRVASLADKAAININPLMLPVKGARLAGKTVQGIGSNVVAPILGKTTGAGTESIRRAAAAGAEGGDAEQALISTMRGKQGAEETLQGAKTAHANMYGENSAQYKADLAPVFADKTVLDFKPIRAAMDDIDNAGQYKGVNINTKTSGIKAELKQVIDEWEALPANEYHTVEGLDSLKKSLGEVRDATEPRTPQRIIADKAYNAVKTQIEKQAPAYGDAMKRYGTAAALNKEISKALSLGDKTAADTAIRKLQSVMRNDANTNYGHRVSLVDKLTENGAPYLMEELAGMSLNAPMPRGIAGGVLPASMTGATLAGWAGVPSIAGALLTSSPRVVGEMALKAGQAKRLLTAPQRAVSKLFKGKQPPAASAITPDEPTPPIAPQPAPRSLADALQLTDNAGSGTMIKLSDGSTITRADRVKQLVEDKGYSKADAIAKADFEAVNPAKTPPQPTQIHGKGTIRLGSDKPKVKQLPPERLGETVKNERGTFEKFASEQEALDFAEAHGIAATHEPKMLFGAYQLNAKPKPSLADKITPPAQKGAGIKDTDDLLTAIKKLGGIDAEIAEGIEKHSVISKTGRSYDDLAESLRDYGYDVTDANDLIDKVSRSVNQGEKIHTANGSAAKAAKDFKARSLADKLNNKQEK